MPITRRKALATTGLAGVFIPAWNETVEAADTLTCVLTTPTTTEGPYWVDEKLFRQDIRTDPTDGTTKTGVPLTLTINIQNLSGSSCTPLVGAYVDIWHCDAKGIYSDVSQSYNPGGGTGTVNTAGKKFLRGYQITDDNGQVKFTTIFPGWYSGRTIHIHIRVRSYNGTTVLSNFVSQIFFDETTNNTVLGSTNYSRTSSRDTTNASDNIYGGNTRMLASASGSVDAGYTASITMGASFQTAASSGPSVASGGVANALSGAAGITPGAWISIYGSALAAATRQVATSDLVNSVLPTTLGGVSVQINGKAAYLQFVSASQINVLAPTDANRGSVTVAVTNSSGTSSTTANLVNVLPGLATLSNYVRAVRSDGTIINGTGNAETGYKVSAAIGPGDILSLYGTGFGAVSNTPADGLVFTGSYPTTNTVTVTIGGAAAQVLYAGLVGPGLYQINVVIPSTLADGEHTVIATVAGSSSQNTARVKVAAAAKLSANATDLRIWKEKRQERLDWLAKVIALPLDGEAVNCLVQLDDPGIKEA
jgi:uncharacterized protein (TIGR03437 family)